MELKTIKEVKEKEKQINNKVIEATSKKKKAETLNYLKENIKEYEGLINKEVIQLEYDKLVKDLKEDYKEIEKIKKEIKELVGFEIDSTLTLSTLLKIIYKVMNDE